MLNSTASFYIVRANEVVLNPCHMTHMTDVSSPPMVFFFGMVGKWEGMDLFHGIYSNKSEAHFTL